MKVRRVFAGLILGLAAIAACGCGKDDPPPPRTSITPSDSDGAPIAGMAHGNHDPKYGGVVLMNEDDLHFEVVAKPDGAYKVYFSDSSRNELPASVASSVRLSIRRPGYRGEPVVLQIDPTGEFWEGHGGSVDDHGTTILMLYSLQGKNHDADFPFFAGQDTKAGMTGMMN